MRFAAVLLLQLNNMTQKLFDKLYIEPAAIEDAEPVPTVGLQSVNLGDVAYTDTVGSG